MIGSSPIEAEKRADRADQVRSFVENGVGRIRLNRPEAIHAFTMDMCVAINAALIRLVESSVVTDFVEDMRNEYRIACHAIRRPHPLEGGGAVIFVHDNAPGSKMSAPFEKRADRPSVQNH